MRYDGVYKRYKLNSVTEEDIDETGGAGASRYVNNSGFVFLPDIEKREIGTELFVSSNINMAKGQIEEKEKKRIREIIDEAKKESVEREEEKRKEQRNRDEEERRREEERK